MATSYALPTSAIPHHHHHSSDHFHAHTHSHSHSPPNLSSLNPSRTMRRDPRPNGSLSHNRSHGHSHSHAHDDEHDHDHDHDHDHGHSHSHHRANSNHPMQSRPNLPPPLEPNGHWRADSTPGGKPLITPKHTRFDPAVQYEPPAQSHAHAHAHHEHSVERSKFTSLLLPYTEKWPLLHAVIVEKDSRRIFYFMTLNFAFMAVQAFYGYATDSLGLLSDSIHMFFDCVALAVGLFAAVASKWPPSERFPYGFGKIETLSGFANGVFLILISIEIMFEACERIMEGRETKRLGELFVVSTLGLLVNLVGMMAFGHHHHGHSHGHAHDNDSHGCGGHGHDHSHSHDEKHGHSHGGHSHSHGHSHDNENMHGIYLHVLADTLGSAAVIVSTILTYYWSWAGWDPLASFLIAVLILLSAMPLVKSSARRLLLTIPDEIEYNLRDTLSGICGLRGVIGYSAPKFWLDDRNSGEDSGNKLLGVMHVVAARGADMEDVRDRVRNYLLERNIDITLQVEREGDTSCWCGVGRSPLSNSSHSHHKSTHSITTF
ncbi:cation efflux family-domain-containing protein [Diplogelasinospora grovesii]|uniref:Zinc transporter n=1 Tax=Diplogelasinospora grovesii TaxID=303347 RepID=A0AAN6N9L1_9PEZI|nr:cation efflux family-domain-containing protein [Diplogelasinospora grovesii]